MSNVTGHRYYKIEIYNREMGERVMKKMKIWMFTLAFGALVIVSSVTAYAATGWQQENGSWYYYQGDSKQTGWLSNNKMKYYLGEDGRMKSGWQNINGKWYMFHGDGGMHTGWYLDGSTWYYLTLDGSMLTDGYAPDGHWMNSDGSWNPDKKDEAGILNVTTGWEPSREYIKFITNWETDVDAYGAGAGQLDVAITSALLGRTSVDVLNAKEKAVYDVAKKFIETEIKDTDSDYEKVTKITLFMWSKIEYSKTVNGEGGAHEALVNGKAVCAGFARTFKILANAVGLECYHVSNSKANHEWNIVRIDGDWYNADTTGSGRTEAHLYLLHTCDNEWAFSRNIDPSKFVTYPKCTATKYTRTNMLGK